MTDHGNRPEEPTRSAPHNLDAEASILGAALLSSKALAVLATELRPGDFYLPTHGRLATVLTEAFESGDVVDDVTIANALEARGWITPDELDRRTLTSLMATTPSTSAAPGYAKIVHGHATLRRLIESAERITSIGYEKGDPHEAVVAARAILDGVAAQNGSRTYSTVEIADSAALLEGDLEPPEADFLTRSDGRSLLYAGKMHVFQAEPSTGKSWLALQAATEILAVGGAVLYLDYEDSSRGILGRLLALGADPANVRERFVYAQPIGAFGAAEKSEIQRVLDRLNPDLVVIDGVAEALARDGYSEDKAADVVAWGEKLPRWLARTGAAVLMLDHVVKERESQGRWARGSGAKLGMVDGASYSLRQAGGFSRQKAGGMRGTIAKDRPGGVGSVGDVAFEISIEPHADGARVVLKIDPPNLATKRTSDAWRPTRLMTRLSEEIEQSKTPLTPKAVKAMVHSDKPRTVSEALARLLAEGYVRETRQGSATFLVHVRPFHEGAEDPVPDPGPPELPLEPAGPDNVTDLASWKDDNF